MTEEMSQQEGLKERASAKVDDAASAAQEKASELREQGSNQLRDQLDRRSNEASTQVRSLASALRRSGEDLDNEGNAKTSQLTMQAADRIDRLGGYLEQKSGDELLRDIEGFARRRPWMIAGLGMLAGIAAARFVKASSERRYDEYRRTGGPSATERGVGYGRAGAGTYGQPELSRGSVEPGTVGAEGQRSRGDEPLTRDPYARTR